ncbi:hypothetical protein BK675_11300 [Pseudomonas fluorescens]|nr:hypothetical protein BK677_01950 [Pseudomonas fluorescens]ROO08559.1 hypothetical protein BK675_11300 [Pseudomonas fluorescens]RRW67524.1 hypothetical protein EGJ53_07550 [Pseudomonas fluorescens]
MAGWLILVTKNFWRNKEKHISPTRVFSTIASFERKVFFFPPNDILDFAFVSNNFKMNPIFLTVNFARLTYDIFSIYFFSFSWRGQTNFCEMHID